MNAVARSAFGAITHVETTAAGVADASMTAPIQHALAAKGLTPAEHLVDAGYTSAELFLESARAHDGLVLVGPMRRDVRWQTRAEEGFGADKFTADWAAKKVRCPEGKLSRKWVVLNSADGHAVISVRFGRSDCAACPSRARCTRARGAGRELTLRAQAQYEVLQAQRQEQTTPEWKALYAKRAGVEGTFSQAVRAHGLRRSRYRGRAKTHPSTSPRQRPSTWSAWTAGYAVGPRRRRAAPVSPPSKSSSPTVSTCCSRPSIHSMTSMT